MAEDKLSLVVGDDKVETGREMIIAGERIIECCTEPLVIDRRDHDGSSGSKILKDNPEPKQTRKSEDEEGTDGEEKQIKKMKKCWFDRIDEDGDEEDMPDDIKAFLLNYSTKTD